jgi:hypothetical protein
MLIGNLFINLLVEKSGLKWLHAKVEISSIGFDSKSINFVFLFSIGFSQFPDV